MSGTDMQGAGLASASENSVRILWIRHGETEDNARKIIQGHIDTALNDAGVAQAERTRDALADTHIDVCYTSDLSRAKRTAEIIMEAHADSPLIVDARIKEKALGLLEGTVYYKPHPPEVMETIEPLETFTKRLLDFFDAMFPLDPKGKSAATSIIPELETKRNITVLVVSHGGPIKVILPTLWKRRNVIWDPSAEERGRQLKYRVWNCSISELVMKPCHPDDGQASSQKTAPRSGWTGVVTRFADVSHLDGALAAPREGTSADDVADEPQEEAKRKQQVEESVQWFDPNKS